MMIMDNNRKKYETTKESVSDNTIKEKSSIVIDESVVVPVSKVGDRPQEPNPDSN
jgi:hypothetical protein